MLIGDITLQVLARRLSTSGVDLNTGAFTTRLHTDRRNLVDAIAEIYADFPVNESPGICDIVVRMARPPALRGAFRRQIQAYVGDELPFQPLPERLAFPMMETALNWGIAMWGHHYLILHAAVVERDGHGLIIPGPSGSGKSTLCAGLLCRGWRLLSDEFALIRPQDGRLQPNPRPVSLKNDSITILRRFGPQMRYSAAWDGTIKGTVAYMLPPADAVARASDPVMPSHIVFPSYESGTMAQLKPVAKATAFKRLVDDSVNYFICLKAGFDALTRLVETCNLYLLTYGALDPASAILAELLHQTSSPAMARL